MCKTEGSPAGLGKNLGRLNGWNIPLAKVVDFLPLGAIYGPGSPVIYLAQFHLRATPMEHLRNTRNSLKFLWFYKHVEISNEPQIAKLWHVYQNGADSSKHHAFWNITIVTIVRERSRFFKFENIMNSQNPYFLKRGSHLGMPCTLHVFQELLIFA